MTTWAACINQLSPLPYGLKTEIPKFIKQAFNEAGRANDDELLIPVRPVALLGSCSTAAYADCPNLPQHHIDNSQGNHAADYLNRVGRYYWFDFDVVGQNEAPLPLRMVFNEGDGDCNDGLWGAVWQRHTKELIANILSTGDSEATVAVLSTAIADQYEPQTSWIPTTFDRAKGFDPLPCESVVYANNLSLEKIIGLAIRICSLYRHEWSYTTQGYDF